MLRKFWLVFFSLVCCLALYCNKFLLVGTTVWYVGGASLHIVAAVLRVGSTEGSTKSPSGGTCSCNVPLEAVACSGSCRSTPTRLAACVEAWAFQQALTGRCRLLAERYNSVVQAGWKIVLMLLCKQNTILVSRWPTWKSTCSSWYLCKWAACQWFTQRRKLILHVPPSHQVRKATRFLH